MIFYDENLKKSISLIAAESNFKQFISSLFIRSIYSFKISQMKTDLYLKQM